MPLRIVCDGGCGLEVGQDDQRIGWVQIRVFARQVGDGREVFRVPALPMSNYMSDALELCPKCAESRIAGLKFTMPPGLR